MTFFVLSVLTVNLILWAILLIRFKRIFSTDKIVEKTEQQINHFIKEINKAADRDTFLAKETSKRIQNMLDEADQKMELFQQASSRLRDMIAEADKILKGQKYTITQVVDPDAAYEVNISKTKPQQGNLFESAQDTYTNKKPVKSIQKNETIVTPDGAAFQEIPLIITKVYDEQETKKLSKEEIKRRLPEFVRREFANGLTVEEIAAKFNCSITEVQFIIDMYVDPLAGPVK